MAESVGVPRHAFEIQVAVNASMDAFPDTSFEQAHQMNSTDLLNNGFFPWHKFNPENEHSLLSILPKKLGVYVIRRTKAVHRLVGQSDIIYVGSATNTNGLNGRIRQYFHPGPTQRTNQRVLAAIAESNEFELSFVECATTEDAKGLEKHLLSRYADEHSELPPLNRQG